MIDEILNVFELFEIFLFYISYLASDVQLPMKIILFDTAHQRKSFIKNCCVSI